MFYDIIPVSTSNSAYGQNGLCALFFISEGRLKSPAIDFSANANIAYCLLQTAY